MQPFDNNIIWFWSPPLRSCRFAGTQAIGPSTSRAGCNVTGNRAGYGVRPAEW